MNEPANIARIHADSQDHALRKSLGYYGKSGRQSFVEGEVVGGPTTFSQIRGLLNGYAPLGYMLPWETLDYVEILATYNPDYSQAVENIKMLSNSGHELMVSSSSDLATRRLKARLETKARTLQEGHGGIDGIIDKLMDQAATYGAMCGEIVLSDDLSDVVDFVDLNPKKIRFFWDEDLGKYMPYQKVSAEQAKKAESRGQKTINNCIALNPLTFRYYAFDAAPESPYGTPPFLAALYNIAIQRDLVANMAQIVKKIGLLGIIDVEVERLAVQPGETDEAYVARAREYLSGYAEAAGEMAKEGGLTHFDDVKVTTTQLGGNAAGATNIHKANEEMVFSGLKSMPSLQGRCLDPNTLVLMADGSQVALRDVEVGDQIQGFDEHTSSSRRRWVTAKIENKWEVRKKSLRLHLADGRSIVASEDHPFLMQDQPSGKHVGTNWSRTKLTPEQRTETARHAALSRWEGNDDEFKGTDWKRAKNIREGEWIKAIKTPLPIDYDSDDYKAGYLAGHNSGDGCFRLKSPGKHHYWTFYAPEFEEETLDVCERYAYELGLPEPFGTRFYSTPRSYPEKGINASVRMVSIKTCRQSNMDFLVPLHNHRDTDEYRAGWLAGLYDTDGSRSLRSRGREQVRICQEDGEVKDRAERYLAELGFVATRHDHFLEIVGDRLEKWRFTATICPVLDRKVVRLDDRTVRTFHPVRVERIEELGHRNLIDITTTSSTFVGDGLLTHNSFSTTETYAGVAYEITLRNTAKYQRAAKRIVESMYWMMADLWGERPTSIKIQFNTNRALNRIQEAQAEQAEINNAIMLWIIGILDQTGVAQKLGYADVSESMEHPPESVVGSYVVEMSAEQQLDFDNQQPTSAKMEEIEDDEQD